MIKHDDVLMGRAKFQDLPRELKLNLIALVDAVNKLFPEGGKVVSSGYRPAAINAGVGGSKKSAHMSCQAVDLRDNKSQDLARWCVKNTLLLEQAGLYMEDPRWTPTWVHLQIRPTRNRIFIPYSIGDARYEEVVKKWTTIEAFLKSKDNA